MLRNAPLDAAVSVVLALTIFAFAAGSSSVPEVNDRADGARWAMLGVLLATAAFYAARRRPPFATVPATTLAAAVLAALALGSVLWSVTPRLTLERGTSLAVTIAATALLAYGAGAVGPRVELILYGVLGAAVAVGLASLLVFAVDSGAAVNGKTSQFISRFQGFGERPTTDAMLYGLALPVAGLLVARAATTAWRTAGLAAFTLVDGLLIASGSRGPQVAALVGLAVLAVGVSWRGRLWLAGAIAATVVIAIVINLAQTKEYAPATRAVRPPAPKGPTYVNPGGLAQELGPRGKGLIRTLFGSSGRTDAWRAALDKAGERPALGFGFGTEDRVFEDHYYNYQGSLVSSSWVGLYLQLGAFGVAAFATLWLALLAAVLAAARRLRGDPVAAACAAVTLAALPLSFVESWIYSVGNVGTLPFWVGALLLGAAVWGRRAAA